MNTHTPQRKSLIFGNWKSNGTLDTVKKLIGGVYNQAQFDDSQVEIVVAPVAIHLQTVKAMVNPRVKVAAQNMSRTGQGAFNGEITCDQLKDLSIDWVIIGHEERRIMYGETDEDVAAKLLQAQKYGLHSLVCIGDTVEQKMYGKTNEALAFQLEAMKKSVHDWSKIAIAYQAIWTVGTGKSAGAEIAQDTHSFIRQWLCDNVSNDVAQQTRILYCGTVNPMNAATLIAKPDIDGFLIGSVSLKPDFLQVISIVSPPNPHVAFAEITTKENGACQQCLQF